MDVCEHLQDVKDLAVTGGVAVVSAGQLWSKNCRYWIYFDGYFNSRAVRELVNLDPCVIDHEHLGTHDGREMGFYCEQCLDGVMGVHRLDMDGKKSIP